MVAIDFEMWLWSPMILAEKVPQRGVDKRKTYSFSFYMGCLSRTFTIHRTAREGGGYLFNSSLPLPPASQTLRHQHGNYCRELTSAHSYQPDSNWEPLVSECKSLTTKLCVLEDLLGSQVSVTIVGFELQNSCICGSYLTHQAIRHRN